MFKAEFMNPAARAIEIIKVVKSFINGIINKNKVAIIHEAFIVFNLPMLSPKYEVTIIDKIPPI
jgi:hypothetical protein